MIRTVLFLAAINPFSSKTLPLDSLHRKINEERNIRQKLEMIADYVYDVKRSYPDSALAYGELALRIANHDSLLPQKIRILTNIGTVYLDKGAYNKADSIYELALALAYRIHDMKMVAMIYNNYGLSQSNQNKYDKAIEFYLKAAHISDSLGIRETSARTLVNIGIIYYTQNNVRKALDYHLSALYKIEKFNLDLGIMTAVALRNVGAFYHLLGMSDSAYFYTNRSLKISQQYGDKRGLAICYHNLGDFIVNHDAEKAKSYYLKSLVLKQEMNNLPGIAITAGGLGMAYHMTKQYSQAIDYLQLAIETAKKIGELSYQMEAYKRLSQIYEDLGDTKSALRYFKFYADYRDSIAQRTSEKKLLELQTQYETAQKEKQIAELKYRQEISEITIKNTRKLLYITLSGSAIIAVLLGIVSWALVSIRRQRNILKEKNVLIEQQNEEIRVQRDYLIESNNKIQFQNRQIQDSISYARQIQNSLLPGYQHLKEIIGNFALLYLPKDVVSGDFYWGYQNNNYVFIAVGDCTGHGVPGAFMSVLSISLLNEIIKGKQILQPAKILNELRELIMLSLKQNTDRMGGSDGLELALCRIDKNANQLVFAGAQRPLFILKNHTLTELQPNKMPISAHVTMENFSETVLEISGGETLYMFTDGFSDQPGGNGNHRYGKQQFRELIRNISLLPIDQQTSALETEFNKWKADNEQIDDVLVMGFCV